MRVNKKPEPQLLGLVSYKKIMSVLYFPVRLSEAGVPEEGDVGSSILTTHSIHYLYEYCWSICAEHLFNKHTKRVKIGQMMFDLWRDKMLRTLEHFCHLLRFFGEITNFGVSYNYGPKESLQNKIKIQTWDICLTWGWGGLVPSSLIGFLSVVVCTN